MIEKQTTEIKQEILFNVIDRIIGYLKIVVAMLEELREGKDTTCT